MTLKIAAAVGFIAINVWYFNFLLSSKISLIFFILIWFKLLMLKFYIYSYKFVS